jgi:hypothetical protein
MKSSLILPLLLLSACVGAQFNETAPLQSQIQEQHAKASQLFDNAKSDFGEKSYVFKNLKMKDPLRDNFEIMSKDMDDLEQIHKRLETEKNSFMLLTKGKAQISSKDKAWEPEQNTLKSFNADMALFNKTLANYSNQSATFAQTVTQNKMMVLADVSEIKTRMKDAVGKGKKSLQVIDADIAAAKKIAKSNGVPMSDAAKQTVDAERNLFSQTLKELEDLYSTFTKQWGSKKQKSNTDADWDQFRKVVAKSEIKAKDLHDIGERIPIELEDVKNSQ